MKLQHFLVVAFLCCIHVFVPAQVRVPGHILLQLNGEEPIEAILEQFNHSFPDIHAVVGRTLAASWRIYLIEFRERATEQPDDLLGFLRHTPGVNAVQWDHEVEERNVEPNDPGWQQQADLRLIGMPDVWERTTGGVTPNGDTIVLAVLEKGMQKEHPDLLPALWYNKKEIPDNNTDDDNNGYIDDYYGWDAKTGKGDGNGTGSSHGTSVHGIIGARGNNSFGTSGINWNVRLMSLVNVFLESEIVASYNYVAEQRALYNRSNGKEGAFVVATNASFGLDNAKAEDYVLWCSAYDSLGVLGVLSVGATSNKNVDVDVVGDMPTTCTSEFLITTTNVDAVTGNRVTSSGFGSVSIDLGAPGQNSFTIINRLVNSPGDTTYTGTFGGTSAAAPHVTGAIGVLYSLPCESFVLDATTAPLACARRVRDAILSNVVFEETLEERTTTAGRLNVANIMDDVIELCAGVTGEMDITDIRPNPTTDILFIRYQTPDYEAKYSLQVYNMLGQLVADNPLTPRLAEPKLSSLTVTNYPRGTYILVLNDGEKIISKKFVKI